VLKHNTFTMTFRFQTVLVGLETKRLLDKIVTSRLQFCLPECLPHEATPGMAGLTLTEF